ncbi:MAG: hypothetical protein IKD66_09040 [Solobacterium sp.]|nr:hypothetical protein [Solobacterium sp.]
MNEIILVLISIPIGVLTSTIMRSVLQVHEKEKARSIVLGVIGAVLGGLWASSVLPDILYSFIGAAAVLFVYYKIIGGGNRY